MEISYGETHCEVTIPHFEYGSVIGGSQINPYSILKVCEAGRAVGFSLMKKVCERYGGHFKEMFFLKWQEIEILPEFYKPQLNYFENGYFDFVCKNMKLYHYFFPVGNTSQFMEDTVVNKDTKTPLITSSALIVNVDPKSRKPAPFNTTVKEFFTLDRCKKRSSNSKPPPSVQRESEIPDRNFTRSSAISIRHLDTNNHANQAAYADICFDCLGDAFHKSIFGNHGSIFKHDLRRMSFLYVNECFLGDQIDTTVWQHKENPLIFIFHLKKGSKLICEAEFEVYKFNHSPKSHL